MVLIISAVLVSVGIGLGIYFGSQGNPEIRPPGDNKKTAECESACKQWDNRRAERCAAEAIEEDARQRYDMLIKITLALMAGAFTVVVALLGSAAMIALLSELVIPAAIAASILMLAIGVVLVAMALLAFFSAASATAYIIWTQKQQATAEARNAENEARSMVMEACDVEQANTCFELPGPC